MAHERRKIRERRAALTQGQGKLCRASSVVLCVRAGHGEQGIDQLLHQRAASGVLLGKAGDSLRQGGGGLQHALKRAGLPKSLVLDEAPFKIIIA